MAKTTWGKDIIEVETVAHIPELHFDWLGATIVVVLLVLVGFIGHKFNWWKL